MKPEVMISQVKDLPNLTREQTPRFDKKVREALSIKELQGFERVFLTGDGDSYHAACAVEMAFENLAGVPCEPLSAQRYLDYAAEWMPVAGQNTLLVAISASGRTERGLQCMDRGREFGALPVAVTGTPGSAFTETADRAIVVDLPDFGRSPGIRTYNANLMGLLLLALALGEAQGKLSTADATALKAEMIGLADVMDRTLAAAEGPARAATEALQDATMMAYLGSGPSYGTAMFSAAKFVEAAGIFAIGQDLEEWAHVERFSYPDDMPVFIVAPPGRSHWRAVKLAKQATELGRRLSVVAQEGDQAVIEPAQFVYHVVGDVREEFSPLVYHIPANFLSSYLTEKLGRMLFQTDRHGGW